MRAGCYFIGICFFLNLRREREMRKAATIDFCVREPSIVEGKIVT